MKRTNWLAGLVVGVVGSVLFWVFPTLGAAILVLFGLIAATRQQGSFGVSGLLVGAGGCSLIVLARSIYQCTAFDAAPNQECTQPDLTPWLVAAAVLLLMGVATLAIGVRRAG